MNKAQRLRDLEALDHKLRDLDMENADNYRRQVVRIREAREAVGRLKAATKSDVEEDPGA